ncbi:MAG: exo-alpha-sialidase [Flavobacteriaceae bacterium]|nr:exo-alpha-sialidase [Bacteroidia bacterium]NNK28780.1 exo-alpha-sialidase [Flavobacteriaceae bacterium]NNL61444.1 exo-alpha-sialidase [Flavobacteriaceae bacterium]RZV65432.1 MAG: exo-alpha-sialidase [Flavobacteriaceae bacterium]
MIRKGVICVAILASIWSCNKESEQAIVYFDNPGSTAGSEPNLHVSENGTIYLSWIQAKEKEKSKLFLSKLIEHDLTWAEPKLISEGDDWFVNWADFPSITSFGNSSLAAHYLAKSATGTYDYNVNITISNDDGNTWNTSLIPHDDKTNSEHGFVSKVALANNEFLSVWLDGRKYAYAEKDSSIAKEMTLRCATIDNKGLLSEELELDDRVCDCCQTDTAMTQNGPIVVYRDRTAKEIRDISYVRRVDGKWTEPKSLHSDNWSIFGCPVNGPAITTHKSKVAVAWFTAANDHAEVKVAFSEDNGASFGKPITVNQEKPSGRVDIQFIDEESILVSWLDNVNENALIQLQKIQENGIKSPVISVTETSEERSSGFPRMVVKNDQAFIAWTNSGDSLTVKTAKINTAYFPTLKN